MDVGSSFAIRCAEDGTTYDLVDFIMVEAIALRDTEGHGAPTPFRSTVAIMVGSET